MVSPTTPRVILPRSGQGGSRLVWRGLHIGDLLPGGRWRKEINPKYHWCRKYDAPGFQAEVYDDLRARGQLCSLEVFDRRTRCILRAPLEVVEEHGIRDTLNPLNGEQVFLPRRYWDIEHPEGYQYPLQFAGAVAGS